jgi:hypothetical protein
MASVTAPASTASAISVSFTRFTEHTPLGDRLDDTARSVDPHRLFRDAAAIVKSDTSLEDRSRTAVLQLLRRLGKVFSGKFCGCRLKIDWGCGQSFSVDSVNRICPSRLSLAIDIMRDQGESFWADCDDSTTLTSARQVFVKSLEDAADAQPLASAVPLSGVLDIFLFDVDC